MKMFARMGNARYVVILLVVVSVLLSFGSVWASSGGGGHGGGMDKGKDLIWRIMNFAVLIGALIFLLRKPLAHGLESRRQGVKDQLDDLARQKQEAEKRLAEYKDKLALLDKEVQRITAEYIQEGEAAKARIIEEAKAAGEKLQEQAKKNIEHEFQRAKQQLKTDMAEQAVAMAEGLIKKNIKDKDQERIIDEYLTKVVVAQ
ncbi:MAG: ATP synthase F0 subunit B [Desulfobacterales bacterium]|nr:ATP synthase F0 subunit B [Desulfobacterales bacterium]